MNESCEKINKIFIMAYLDKALSNNLKNSY